MVKLLHDQENHQYQQVNRVDFLLDKQYHEKSIKFQNKITLFLSIFRYTSSDINVAIERPIS